MPRFVPETVEQQRTQVQRAVEAIRGEAPHRAPAVAIILGSGMGDFADTLSDRVEIPYARIPGFPTPAVAGHAGTLVLGRKGDRDVVVMRGRGHFYEGYAPQQLAMPVRVMRRLGAGTLVITNAAGSANPSLDAGSLMWINDHINFSGYNPLTGPNDAEAGVRFPDNSAVYDRELRRIALDFAASQGWDLPAGNYMFMTGPNFETPAEIRMAQKLGADVVGMSTFPEALTGFHCGMRVAGISYISNMGTGILPGKLDHAHVLEMPEACRAHLTQLIHHLIQSV